MSKILMQKIFRCANEKDRFYLRLCLKDDKYCLTSNIPMSLIKWIKPDVTGILENKHGKSQDEVEMYVLFLGHAVLERAEAKPHFYPNFVLNEHGYLDRNKFNEYREKVRDFNEQGTNYAFVYEHPELCHYLGTFAAQSRLMIDKNYTSTVITKKHYEKHLHRDKWKFDYVDVYKKVKAYLKVWSHTEAINYYVALNKNNAPIQCIINRGFML